MGWSSAGNIFDPVAQALIDTGATPEVKRKVLGDLINGLQDGDWDTEDESLEQFKDDPAIVQAFADHGVSLPVDPEADREALTAIAEFARRLMSRADDVAATVPAVGVIHDLACGRITTDRARAEFAAVPFRDA